MTNENAKLGQLVSQFVMERVDTPHPEEVEIWTQLVYAALFSTGFVAWFSIVKVYSSEKEMSTGLNRLIGEIAEDANVWIGAKIREALQIAGSNIYVDSRDEVRLHLGAMFSEAIGMMTEHKFEPEAARSHACFVHLSKNLQKLALTGEVAIDVQSILKQGIAGTDAMAAEARGTLKPK